VPKGHIHASWYANGLSPFSENNAYKFDQLLNFDKFDQIYTNVNVEPGKANGQWTDI
jgi:hypothetical protein